MLHDFATILAVTNGIVTGSDCEVGVLHELVVRALLVDIEIDAVDVHAFRRETKSFALARELFECAAQHIRRRERLDIAPDSGVDTDPIDERPKIARRCDERRSRDGPFDSGVDFIDRAARHGRPVSDSMSFVEDDTVERDRGQNFRAHGGLVRRDRDVVVDDVSVDRMPRIDRVGRVDTAVSGEREHRQL